MLVAARSLLLSKWTVAIVVGLVGALAMVLGGDVELKYRLAAVLALGGFAALIVFPERRIACVLLWLLVHPMGVEKVFFLDAAEGPMFTDPTLNINVSDGPLILLIVFLAAETILSGRSAFRWSRLATVLVVYSLWSAISFGIHAAFLRDGYTTSAPITLMQDIRLILFVVIIQSAIRTRADVALVLSTIAAALLIQIGFVYLSYATNQVYTYAAGTSAEGSAATLQGFASAGGGEMSRASGTVGHTNEQALFHAVMTIPLIAFLVSRNRLVWLAALGIIAGSALAMVLTFSRGSWIAFPFGVLVCGILFFRRYGLSRNMALTGSLAAMGGALALGLLIQPIYQRLANGDTGASASRLRQINLGLDVFLDHPVIGVGPGEYAQAVLLTYPYGSREPVSVQPGEVLPYPPPTQGRLDVEEIRLGSLYLRRPLPVHNKYVLTLAELGAVGLAIWLWFYFEFIRVALHTARRPDRFLEAVGIAGVGIAAAQLVYMMFDLFVEDKPLEIMMFLPALVAAAARCTDTRISPSRASLAAA